MEDQVVPYEQRVERFVDVFIQCGKGAVAAREAGIPAGSIHRLLKMHKAEIIERLQDQIIEHAPEAIRKLGDMLGEGAMEGGASNRLAAAKEILDRVGIVKKDKIEIETTHNAIVLLPLKREQQE